VIDAGLGQKKCGAGWKDLRSGVGAVRCLRVRDVFKICGAAADKIFQGKQGSSAYSLCKKLRTQSSRKFAGKPMHTSIFLIRWKSSCILLLELTIA